MKESPSILSRLLSAFVGLLTGGLVGMLALYFVMLLVGSDFGLDNVRAERCVRAGLGRMEQQPNGKLKFVGPIPPRFQAMCSPKPRQRRCFPIGRNADYGSQDPVYISAVSNCGRKGLERGRRKATSSFGRAT